MLAGRVGALDIYRLRDEPRAIILVAYQVRLEGDVQRRRNLSLTAPFRPAQRSAGPVCSKIGSNWDRCGAHFVEPIDLPR